MAISSQEFNTAKKNLKKVEENLKESLHGKNEIIQMMFVCAIAQEPMLLFGPPGTAKSKIVTLFCDQLGIKSAAEIGKDGNNKEPFYFQYLLTQFTEPDELFGPVNIEKLKKEGIYLRDKWRQMMPGASVVFLDEVFRANSAILNSLLTLINERSFYEAGQSNTANVDVVFGAANKPPARDDLIAFYDRFPIRMYSEPVSLAVDNASKSLVERGWKLEIDQMEKKQPKKDGGLVTLKTAATYHDLEVMQRYLIEQWKVDSENWKTLANQHVYEGFKELVKNLREESNINLSQVSVSDRKIIKMLKVVLAHALWTCENPLQPQFKDLLVFKYISDDPTRSFNRDILANSVRTQIYNFYTTWNKDALKKDMEKDPEFNEILAASTNQANLIR